MIGLALALWSGALEARADSIRVSDPRILRPKRSSFPEAAYRGPVKLPPGVTPFQLHDHGTSLYVSGKQKEARAAWNLAAKAEPNLAPAEIAEILTLIAARELALAQMAMGKLEASHAQSAHYWMARSDFAVSQNKADEAISALEKAIELNPKLMAPYFSLARILEATGKIERANDLLSAAAKANPKRPEAWFFLGQAAFRENRLEDCLAALLKVEEFDENQTNAELRIGHLYLEQNDWIGARAWFARARARKPKDPEISVAFAQSLLALKLRKDARSVLENVLEENEDLAALIALAQLEEVEGNRKQSAALYRRVLKIDAKNIIANNNLAMLIVELGGSADDAMKHIEIAREQNSGEPGIIATHCVVLVRSGKYPLPYLAKSVRQVPDDAWLRWAYGTALLKLGKKKQARDQLEGCLILAPDFVRKAEVEALLKGLR